MDHALDLCQLILGQISELHVNGTASTIFVNIFYGCMVCMETEMAFWLSSLRLKQRCELQKMPQ